MHCLTCGYDLRGLDRNRCPECGRPFDPSDPESYHAESGQQLPACLQTICGLGTIIGASLAGFWVSLPVLYVVRAWYSVDAAAVLGFLVGLFVFAGGIRLAYHGFLIRPLLMSSLIAECVVLIIGCSGSGPFSLTPILKVTGVAVLPFLLGMAVGRLLPREV